MTVLTECLTLGFRVRALGQRTGLVTPWGGGVWGLMRSLKIGGPQTVPALARARPVARQRIQKIADVLVADGLAEFIDNPHHRRSRLLRLTPRGEREFGKLDRVAQETAAVLAANIPKADLLVAARVLASMNSVSTDLLEERT